MKKIRTILTGILLILTSSIFTACGNNNAPADEAGTATEENTTDTGTNENADAVNDKKDNENTDNSNNKVTDNEGVATMLQSITAIPCPREQTMIMCPIIQKMEMWRRILVMVSVILAMELATQ